MPNWRRALTWPFDPESRSLETGPYPITGQRILGVLGGTPAHAGVSVSETTAMNMTAVYSAVTLIADSIASLPLKAYRDRNDGRIEIPFQLGQQPYPDMEGFIFWELVMTHLLLWGNAYLLKIRNELGDQIVKLLPLPPHTVTVRKDQPSTLNPSGKVYKVQLQGNTAEYTPYDLMHIPGLGYDGLIGMSPIQAGRQAIGLGLAAEEFGARFFGSGSLHSVLLTTENEVTQEEAEEVKRRWRDKVAGVAKSHEAVVMGGGIKAERLSIPPEEAQFLQTRQFSIQEIARLYRVPPHLLMDSGATSNWGTGVEEHGRQFVTFTLRPWMTRIEQRVSTHLLPRGTEARFDATELLRGTAAERTAYYTAMKALDAITVDEIRDAEGMSPLPEQDSTPEPADQNVEVPVNEDVNNGA